MKIPLHITFLNIPPSDAVEAEIRKRAEKLDHFAADVMHCHVTVVAAGKHKTQGRLFDVRIDLTLAGSEIAINRIRRHEDVYVVIRDAFDAAARKLEDLVRLRRGDVKQHETPSRGRVTKLFADGYGFIETPDGREFYFHRDNLIHSDFDQIEVGTEVQFLEEAAGEGLQAKRVTTGRVHLPDLPQ